MRQKIIEIIGERLHGELINISENELKYKFDELGIDSLDVAEITMDIEDFFQIEVNDFSADKNMTIEKYIEFISNIVKQKENRKN